MANHFLYPSKYIQVRGVHFPEIQWCVLSVSRAPAFADCITRRRCCLRGVPVKKHLCERLSMTVWISYKGLLNYRASTCLPLHIYTHIYTDTDTQRQMDTYTYMCAHTQTYIYLYIFFFFSSAWSGYNYLSLQGILRALPGSSNKVHHIVERSKGNIIQGEEQNSFLSCTIPCNRSTPLKIIIVVLEPRYLPPTFQEGKRSSCSMAVYRCHYVIFPFLVDK